MRLATLLFALFHLIFPWQEPAGGVTAGASGTPTTVLIGHYGSGSGASANIALSWFGGTPSAGNGVVVYFWHGTGTTVTSVCNGTGADGCTGSDTFTSLGTYTNGTNFKTETYINCNIAATTAPTITLSSAVTTYAAAFFFSGQTTTGGATSCVDTGALHNAQSTTSTQLTGGAVTTTNAADLLVIMAGNNCGGSAYLAGVDGQGNAMTDSGISLSGVLGIGSRTESATNTYTPTVTGGPTCGGGGNAQTLALK